MRLVLRCFLFFRAVTCIPEPIRNFKPFFINPAIEFQLQWSKGAYYINIGVRLGLLDSRFSADLNVFPTSLFAEAKKIWLFI